MAHPAYRPPENFARAGRSIQDIVPIKSSDIWSFGATMYELSTGEVPFGELGGIAQLQGIDPIQIPPKTLSRNLIRILEACISKDPWDRPSADKIRDYAGHYLKTGFWDLSIDSGITFTPPSLSPKKRRKYNLKPLLIALGAVVLLVAGFFLVSNFLTKNPEELLAQAESAIKTKNFAVADDLLEEADRLIKDENVYQMGEYQRLKRICEDSISTGIFRYEERGFSYLESNDLPAAKRAYQEILNKYDPNYVIAQQQVRDIDERIESCYKEKLERANAYKDKNPKEALDAIAEGLKCKPDDEELIALRSAIDQSDSSNQKEQTKDSPDNNPVNLLDQARNNIERERFNTAEENLRQAEGDYDPSQIRTLRNELASAREAAYERYKDRGNQFLANNNCQAARSEFIKARNINNNDEIQQLITAAADSNCGEKIIRSPRAERVPSGSYIRIVHIKLTDKHTVFRMQLKAPADQDFNFNLYQTASSAFYLRDRKNNVDYKLRQVSNEVKIAENQLLKAGQSIQFNLYFDRIPENLKTIDLIEGKEQLAASQNYWNFRGIQLNW